MCAMSQAGPMFAGTGGVNEVSELRYGKRQNFTINWLSGLHE
jgi:hypothetical protein